MRRTAFLFVALAMIYSWGPFPSNQPAMAEPNLRWQGSETSGALPKANPAFRHPRDRHQIFFVQRTTNANTIVYVAQFDDSGTLDPQKPVHIFWRRFAGAGHKMDLRWYERVFGFGVKTRRRGDGPDYDLRFNALKSHSLTLRQNGPFDAALYTRQNNRDYKLIYGYLDVDESGLLPKVVRLRLYSTDPDTGRFVTHTIAVSGGAFRE